MAEEERINIAMSEAERKAWDSLARYKFLMFGYHVAQWVTLNQLLDTPNSNPWRGLVHHARNRIQEKYQGRLLADSKERE